jgi:hypothetical protein
MDEELFSHLVSHLVRDGSRYCIHRCAWTISVAEICAAYRRHLSDLPQRMPALRKALEHGARQGWWELERDPQRRVELVVLGSLAALPAFCQGVQLRHAAS